MIVPSINFLAVIIAAVVNMIIGFAWYSPYVLGSPWMKLMGFTEKSLKEAQKKMGGLYGLSFVAAIIQGAAINALLKMTYAQDLVSALLLGALVWLGFIAVTQFTDAIFNTRAFSIHLLAINTGYQLASILAMTTIIFMWL